MPRAVLECARVPLTLFNQRRNRTVRMKATLLPIALVLALSVSANRAAAETSSKISNVHLCCKGCVDGVDKAVGTVDGAKAAIDSDAGTVTLSGPDKATVQKA